jgi:hypothetical protein
MVNIVFQDGADWFNPNWVFRQLSSDIIESLPGDAELHHAMEKAAAFGLLPLDSTEPVLASRIVRALRTVAERTVDGRIPGWRRTRPADEDGHRMYLEAVTELLDIIQRQPEGNRSEIAPESKPGP